MPKILGGPPSGDKLIRWHVSTDGNACRQAAEREHCEMHQPFVAVLCSANSNRAAAKSAHAVQRKQ